ncbi:low molecular weight phosphatase family protein [Mycobacterium sp. EPG1]|nr:low molecular weight phosphatase family protein [Mycobacterium sp. EPG1]
MRILFVCTGNICRSPTAERLAIAYGAQLDMPDLQIESAGVRAVVGHAIHPYAALVIEGLGADPTNFSARQLNPRIASGADLILTMTQEHRDQVLERAPRAFRRTFTLTEAAQLARLPAADSVADLADLRTMSGPKVTDIPDPINRDIGVFEDVGSLIADCIPPILRLCQR